MKVNKTPSKESVALQKVLEIILKDSNKNIANGVDTVKSTPNNFMEEFKNLNSYSDKLDYWKEKIWNNSGVAVDVTYAQNKRIDILPKNEEQRILFNKERLKLIEEDFEKSIAPKTVRNKNIIYEGLRKDFVINFNKDPKNPKFIESEIARINKEVFDYEYYRASLNNINSEVSIKTNLLYYTFQLISNHNVEPDLGDRVYSKREIIEISIGTSAGKYVQFLKDELLKHKAKRKSQTPEKLWKGDIDSLKLLRKLLKDYEWIDDIDEDEFINHFTNKSFSKSINWLKEQVTFMILFDRLEFAINQTYLIRWEEYNRPSPKELSRHFLFKGIKKSAGQLTKIRFLTTLAKRRKQIKRENEINSIVIIIGQQFKIDS